MFVIYAGQNFDPEVGLQLLQMLGFDNMHSPGDSSSGLSEESAQDPEAGEEEADDNDGDGSDLQFTRALSAKLADVYAGVTESIEEQQVSLVLSS